MAQHNIILETKSLQIGSSPVTFHINADGEKLGRIKISKGNFTWYPYNAKRGIKIDWSKFDDMVRKSKSK